MNPYAQLGLARNPFVAEEEPGVAAPLWVDRGLPDPPPGDPGSFTQLLGPKGAGKTSHLLRWRSREPGPYAHVEPGWRRARPLPLSRVAYWDEADRVPGPLLRLALRRAARRGAAVRCGTHRDLGREAAACGLRVVRFELAAPGADAILEWAARRVAAARLPGATLGFRVGRGEAERLVASCQGCWRRIGERLHVLAADRAHAAVG